MTTNEKTVWSVNDEEFSYFELGDLLNDHPDMAVGDIVYKAIAVKPTISKLVDSSDIFEMICERAYEIADEWSEDWSYSISKEALGVLDKLLDTWAKEHLPEVDFYSVKDSEPYTLTVNDLELSE